MHSRAYRRPASSTERHRSLEPASAEFVAALASGLDAKLLLEIGGSSGISTVALAAAAGATGGKLTSIELESVRQAEARQTIDSLGLGKYVDFLLGDAADLLPTMEEVPFALIDCEKEDYVAHVRERPGVESMTLPIGKGLEITRISKG